MSDRVSKELSMSSWKFYILSREWFIEVYMDNRWLIIIIIIPWNMREKCLTKNQFLLDKNLPLINIDLYDWHGGLTIIDGSTLSEGVRAMFTSLRFRSRWSKLDETADELTIWWNDRAKKANRRGKVQNS